MKKRSLTLAGHKTSIALEEEFWLAVEAIAAEKHISVPALIATIDEQRQAQNLSSAVRVYVLTHFRNQSNSQNK